MKKVIITGCGGQMGRFIASNIKEGTEFSVLCGIDPALPECDFPVYESFEKAPRDADMIIDFSHHSAIKPILEFAVKNHIPCVIATTGHTEDEEKLISEASCSIPIFHSSNMSLGIAVLGDILKTAVDAFPDADIELTEAHHNRKLDAPSGTCKFLMDIVSECRPNAKFVYGRCGMSKREKDDIGVHSLRMGGEVGVHQIIIATETQTLTLEHRAYSRKVFADGAIDAASFLIGKPNALYTMKDYIKR